MKTPSILRTVLVYSAITAASALSAHAQTYYRAPVSPNTNWRANLNGGGRAINTPQSPGARLLESLSDHPSMPTGEMETDRATLERMKQRARIASVQAQIEKERLRRAALAEQETPKVTPVIPARTATILQALGVDRESLEYSIRQRTRRNQPTMSVDTTPAYEREIWQRNQHMLGYQK